jgi:NADH-quinone oxidoreductase subunit L
VIRGFQVSARAMSWFDAKVVDAIVNLCGTITRGIAWVDGAIDHYIVDGAVNLVASGVIAGGREVRKVQTGRINHYLLAVTAGVVVIVLVAYLG